METFQVFNSRTHAKLHETEKEGQRRKLSYFEELSAGSVAPVNPRSFFPLDSLMLGFAGCKFAQLMCSRSGICDGNRRKMEKTFSSPAFENVCSVCLSPKQDLTTGS